MMFIRKGHYKKEWVFGERYIRGGPINKKEAVIREEQIERKGLIRTVASYRRAYESPLERLHIFGDGDRKSVV